MSWGIGLAATAPRSAAPEAAAISSHTVPLTHAQTAAKVRAPAKGKAKAHAKYEAGEAAEANASAKAKAKADAAYAAAKAAKAHPANKNVPAARSAAHKDATAKAAATAKARRSGAPKPPVSPSSTTPPAEAPSPTAPSTTPTARPTPTASPTTPPTVAPSPTVTATPTTTPTVAPSPTTGSNVQPNANNTGVPAGTTLTVYNGNLNANVAGATYSGLDIHGFVNIQAPNVTLKDSIIRGGVSHGDIGLVQDISNAATHFLLEDSEMVPSYPSVQIDGLKGWNYTALRVNIHGTTDGAKMFGPNASIEDSYIHGLVTWAHDPDQGGGMSHNDGVQILSGSNLLVQHNTIVGGTNTALMVTQDHGVTDGLVFNANWVSGGNCTINTTPTPLTTLASMTITNNIFTNDSALHCPLLDTLHTDLIASGNVYAGTGLAIPINDKGGE